MNPTFQLRYDPLMADSKFRELANALQHLGPIDSREQFNFYCREACLIWSKEVDKARHTPSQLFDELLNKIQQHKEATISTLWGGVVVTSYEHPRVEKYLVINKGHYLALEKHDEKIENLEVLDGAGLVLWRAYPGTELEVEAVAPGSRFHFTPGVEHCVIGTEDLLVFEKSTDPKGMDKDLVFIYEPESDVARLSS